MEKNQSKHILIVDDSPDQQFLLKMLLESRGYTTECTTNGKDALKLLRSRKKMPQTILLDLNMEIMDGWEFRHAQRADPLLKDIPVIVVSAEDDVISIGEKMHSYVIKKPLSITSLMEAIERNSNLH
ncbi:MAG: response regulator [Bdellovibrionota bacterium]